MSGDKVLGCGCKKIKQFFYLSFNHAIIWDFETVKNPEFWQKLFDMKSESKKLLDVARTAQLAHI